MLTVPRSEIASRAAFCRLRASNSSPAWPDPAGTSKATGTASDVSIAGPPVGAPMGEQAVSTPATSTAPRRPSDLRARLKTDNM